VTVPQVCLSLTLAAVRDGRDAEEGRKL
jgi:hypothetical protein